MTFIYPAIFTPKKDAPGYHVTFPDLECCEADGPDLEDAIERATDAATSWVLAELEDEDGELPPQTHEEDIVLENGAFIRRIMVRIKLLPDYD